MPLNPVGSFWKAEVTVGSNTDRPAVTAIKIIRIQNNVHTQIFAVEEVVFSYTRFPLKTD
jgi:hypothetical protein